MHNGYSTPNIQKTLNNDKWLIVQHTVTTDLSCLVAISIFVTLREHNPLKLQIDRWMDVMLVA